MTVKKQLKDLRGRVAKLDDKMICLAAERMQLTKKIGQLKRRHNLNVIDRGVEKAIRARIKKAARREGIATELAMSLLDQLIFHSRLEQAKLPRRQERRERCLIVGGKGQMGGWFHAYLRTLGFKVTVFDRQAPSRRTDLAKAAAAADVIFLATPIFVTGEILDQLATAKIRATIFEMNSVKDPIASQLANAKKQGLKVASIHPMFGPSASIVDELRVIVCEGPSVIGRSKVKAFFRESNFLLTAVPLAEHDRLMSIVLGIPHLLNMTFLYHLEHAARMKLRDLAAIGGTTFRRQLEVARKVVSDHPALYYEIQTSNPCTSEAIRGFADSWQAFTGMILRRRKNNFLSVLKRLGAG